MKFKSLVVMLAVLSGFSLTAVASEELDQIVDRLQKVNPNIQIKEIRAAELSGLYEVQLTSGEVLYTGPTGEFFILGSLYQIDNGRFKNLTEDRKKGMRAETLASVKSDDMVIFKPEGETRHIVYAFTDVDCGYCRKLHDEMADYNRHGIEMRYLAFPRAGVNSPAYNKMVSIWCADDPQAAMTLAKSGGVPSVKTCENPVTAQYTLGSQLGVNGTPALFLENGSMMPGYVPADRLAAVLNE